MCEKDLHVIRVCLSDYPCLYLCVCGCPCFLSAPLCVPLCVCLNMCVTECVCVCVCVCESPLLWVSECMLFYWTHFRYSVSFFPFHDLSDLSNGKEYPLTHAQIFRICHLRVATLYVLNLIIVNHELIRYFKINPSWVIRTRLESLCNQHRQSCLSVSQSDEVLILPPIRFFWIFASS